MDKRHRNRILILIFIGVFMGSLDIGIVGPALPAIQGYFSINERLVSWIFAIYILFFMIGTPLMAKLSDIHGRRSIYVLDIFIFALGSIITITSVSFEMMILGRAIQGFGAGGIFPVASAFIGDTFPPEKRGGALGIRFGLGVFRNFGTHNRGFTSSLRLAVVIHYQYTYIRTYHRIKLFYITCFKRKGVCQF